MQVSVLDLSPVTTGGSGAAALRNSIDLARLADRLGYTRYWVAEHHNLPSVASSAPDIMIGQIAAATARIRVGSGGVMLPNHAPLTVAERFHTLEAPFPGRIDLGIGRAPGTDPVTSVALRRRQDIRDDDDFLERFQELMLIESHGFPDGHPFRHIRAMPARGGAPMNCWREPSVWCPARPRSRQEPDDRVPPLMETSKSGRRTACHAVSRAGSNMPCAK
jgi:luciferase family oxidoreductase group 1